MRKIIGFSLALLFPFCGAFAQTDVMRGAEINESALVDALTPPPLTRSLKVSPPSSASILITFETNSTRLTADAKRDLDVVGKAMTNTRLAGLRFVIEGHADRRGSSESNTKLSLERAKAVREYLVRQHDISGARLQTLGKGDSEPMNTRDSAAPENRRVRFVTLTE